MDRASTSLPTARRTPSQSVHEMRSVPAGVRGHRLRELAASGSEAARPPRRRKRRPPRGRRRRAPRSARSPWSQVSAPPLLAGSGWCETNDHVATLPAARGRAGRRCRGDPQGRRAAGAPAAVRRLVLPQGQARPRRAGAGRCRARGGRGDRRADPAGHAAGLPALPQRQPDEDRLLLARPGGRRPLRRRVPRQRRDRRGGLGPAPQGEEEAVVHLRPGHPRRGARDRVAHPRVRRGPPRPGPGPQVVAQGRPAPAAAQCRPAAGRAAGSTADRLRADPAGHLQQRPLRADPRAVRRSRAAGRCRRPTRSARRTRPPRRSPRSSRTCCAARSPPCSARTGRCCRRCSTRSAS